MKKVKSGLFLILFSFYGCSSLSVTDYSSKQDYISHINSSIVRTKIEIYLKNDSVITSKNGGLINNDTLFLSSSFIPLNQINKLSYKTYPLTSCLLGSGAGILAGLLTGVILESTYPSNQEGHGHSENAFVISSLAGLVAGTLIGGFIGWETTYKLDFWY